MKNQTQKMVGRAIRTELDDKTNTLYLVFEIVDDEFKKQILHDWAQDVDLKVINKKLVKKE